MGESESRVALPVCVRVCKLAFVPRPKPTLLLNDTLARPPRSPLQLLQARTSSPSLPLSVPALANSSHVFNISLWALWVLPARAPPPPPPPSPSSSPMRLGRCHHIWETAAGVCSLPSLPSPGACGESVMARLSAGPSPVIRRVNTQRLDGFGRERGRGGGTIRLLSYCYSSSLGATLDWLDCVTCRGEYGITRVPKLKINE